MNAPGPAIGESSTWPPAPRIGPVGTMAACRIANATDIVARFRRPRDFDTGASLAGRLRGALGRALEAADARHAHADRRTKSLRGLPSAWDVLFARPVARFDPPAHLASAPPIRPYRILFKARADAVELRVRLFGRANVWTPQILDAMRQSLEQLGITIAPLARSKARVCSADLGLWSEQTRFSVPPDPDVRTFRCVLHAPLRTGRLHSLSLDQSAIVSSMIGRAIGFAQWSGLILDLSRDTAKEIRDTVAIHDQNVDLSGWQRVSRRRGKREDVVGFTGAFTLAGVPLALSSLFPIIEVSGLGLRTTAGLGDVSILPTSARFG